MSKLFIEDSTLSAIGDAIRAKDGSTDLMTPAQMVTAIGNIETGIEPEGTLGIENNGSYNVREYEYVAVDVAQGVFPTGELEITENGEYDVTALATAIVNVAGGDSASYDWTRATTSSAYKSSSWSFDLSSKIGTEDNVPFVLFLSGGTSTSYNYPMSLYYDGISGFTATDLRATTSSYSAYSKYKSATITNGVVKVTFSAELYPNGSSTGSTFVYVYGAPLTTTDISITANGTYNVTDFQKAIVNVAATGVSGTLSYVTIKASNAGTTKGVTKTFNVSSYISSGDTFAVIYETYCGENKYLRLFPKGTPESKHYNIFSAFSSQPSTWSNPSYTATYSNGVISVTTAGDKYAGDYIVLIYFKE